MRLYPPRNPALAVRGCDLRPGDVIANTGEVVRFVPAHWRYGAAQGHARVLTSPSGPTSNAKNWQRDDAIHPGTIIRVNRPKRS